MHTQDGITHINIYSKGKTEIGRFLSNFSRTPINLTHGNFTSIEGYWYWMLRNDPQNQLKKLYGFKAKQIGKTLPINPKFSEKEFKDHIRNALWIKLHTYPNELKLFTESTLPFMHYYVFNNIEKNAGHKWVIDIWTQFRTHLQANPLF